MDVDDQNDEKYWEKIRNIKKALKIVNEQFWLNLTEAIPKNFSFKTASEADAIKILKEHWDDAKIMYAEEMKERRNAELTMLLKHDFTKMPNESANIKDIVAANKDEYEDTPPTIEEVFVRVENLIRDERKALRRWQEITDNHLATRHYNIEQYEQLCDARFNDFKRRMDKAHQRHADIAYVIDQREMRKEKAAAKREQINRKKLYSLLDETIDEVSNNNESNSNINENTNNRKSFEPGMIYNLDESETEEQKQNTLLKAKTNQKNKTIIKSSHNVNDINQRIKNNSNKGLNNNVDMYDPHAESMRKFQEAKDAYEKNLIEARENVKANFATIINYAEYQPFIIKIGKKYNINDNDIQGNLLPLAADIKEKHLAKHHANLKA